MSATSRLMIACVLLLYCCILVRMTDAVVVHRWAFDGERVRDSVGNAHLSLSGALASLHTIGSSANAVLRLPTTADFAVSQPLGPATLASSFALVVCFRFDPMPTDGLDGENSSSIVHVERSVLTLMQSARVSSSFIELAVVQSAGLDNRNRSACVYSARIHDEGGSSLSGVLGLATGIVQFACWTLVVARSEAVLYVNGAPRTASSCCAVGSFSQWSC
jgi:hypothetical protein